MIFEIKNVGCNFLLNTHTQEVIIKLPPKLSSSQLNILGTAIQTDIILKKVSGVRNPLDPDRLFVYLAPAGRQAMPTLTGLYTDPGAGGTPYKS